jgi:hypothetical protein
MAIANNIRDQLLVESQHRCTICSERCFEIHHILELSEEGTDEPENLIVLCPNCHQHRYHRHKEFTRDQLRLYKKQLQERAEIEKRLLQNLEDIRSTMKDKSAREIKSNLQQELSNAKHLVDQTKMPTFAKSIQQTALEMAKESILPEAARKAIELEHEIERQRIKAQYPEISIVGVDDDAYRKHNKFPRAFEFVILLDKQPNRDWCTVFEDEYRTSFYTMKRETIVSGNRLKMIIADSDNLQRQLDWAKSLVQSTNQRIQNEVSQNIDLQINRNKAAALAEFDAIQSMKERTKNLRI